VIASRFSRALLAVSVAAGAALALPLAGTASASCTRDPYNGVCVTPVHYRLRAHSGTVAVQRKPRTKNVVRRVSNRYPVNVVCQINNGGRVPGYRSHTWLALAGGGWVFAPLVRIRLGGKGFAAGLRHCGAARPPSAPPPPPPPSSSALNPADYPWPTQDGWVGDGHGYYQGECVSFAAWAVRTDGRDHTASPDNLGNAADWTGAYVDPTPHEGDVAQWDAGHDGAGSAGHVAYVAAVNSDGTVRVWEYNWGTFHRLNARTISAATPSRYLRF
jgi:surface antigen